MAIKLQAPPKAAAYNFKQQVAQKMANAPKGLKFQNGPKKPVSVSSLARQYRGM